MLISNLRVSRLTLLSAPSGAGMTSLLRAGVASRLGKLAQRSLEQLGTALNIPVVFSYWKDNPTSDLIREIQRAVSAYMPGPLPDDFPPEQLEGVVAAASRSADATLLVILDQFEEYLFYRAEDMRHDRFADELATCINRPDLRVNFLIAIRDDEYFELGDLFKGRVANVYGNYIQLERLNRESARMAIEGPIAKINELWEREPPFEIDLDLADAVLVQLGRDQFLGDRSGRGPSGGGRAGRRDSDYIDAPYLQVVMETLWRSEIAQGSSRLHAETLEVLGGAQGIVRRLAERALADLTPADREAAAGILGHFVTPSGTNIEVTDSDLAEYTGRSISEITALLEQLARSRIIVPVPPPPGGEGMRWFRIFHPLLGRAIADWAKHPRTGRRKRKK